MCFVPLFQGREAERKKRREAKANPALRKKLRKDLGIPNLNPFKAQILQRVSAYESVGIPSISHTSSCAGVIWDGD